MPNPLLSVRQKIQVVIPEIMNLEFGCEFKIFEEKYRICGRRNDDVFLVNDGKIWSREMIEMRQGIEILGRSISLADVLRAIEKHLREKFESQPNADLLSNFQEGLWGITKDLLKKWNLSQDYDHQKIELYEFLDEILK